MTTLERAQRRLDEIHTEQRRQMAFAGVRLGVFQRLRELARDERRVLRRIEALAAQAAGSVLEGAHA